MATSANKDYFSANVLVNTGYALIAITSATVITRFSIRICKHKPFQTEDALVALAWVSFLTMSISYLIVTPPMYRINSVVNGQKAPYPELEDDLLLMIKIFFYSTMLLWLTLWAVKFSLLTLYRRLMNGLRAYVLLWWILVAFCAFTFIGAIISSLLSCSSMHAWFTPGLCSTPRDTRAQIASLYYSFAVDVLTDLLIMALPLRLIWNLQMPRSEKIGIGALFCCGFICIAIAVVRVVQIGVKAGDSTPSSSWLALWAIVEGSIAVIIGCCPAFAAFWRTKRSESRGYGKQVRSAESGKSGRSGRSGRSGANVHGGVEEVELQEGVASACTGGNVGGGKGRARSEEAEYWPDRNSSQEELAKDCAQRIYVTRSIRQDSEDSGDRRPMR